MEEEDEKLKGIKIVKLGSQYGYQKVNEPNGPFHPVTSWALSPYCYVSDEDIAGVHSVAFICYTYQDQKMHKVQYIALMV